MCGIAGILTIDGRPFPNLERNLGVMNDLIAHRGPDGEGTWSNDSQSVGLAHRRLSVIDLSRAGHQPMLGHDGSALIQNGEIYNYRELRQSLASNWNFKSQSDTEVILAAYHRYGPDCVNHFRGMFAFGLWDGKRLFCARDRFGIKPFYYLIVNDVFYFASEIKSLLPFAASIESDPASLAEYLSFQFTLGNQTMFAGINKLPPGHTLIIENGELRISKYWDLYYQIDETITANTAIEQIRGLMSESMSLHMNADVKIGSYLSGGLDSSLVHIFASDFDNAANLGFNGKFTSHPGFDESHYARIVGEATESTVLEIDINADQFRDNFQNVIYHLDEPIAGPGSFPQYMVAKLASQHVKVVLGGQGGDEIFGGYARYLLAYFEQCINAAIEGNYEQSKFVVTPESIIPNLGVLREYKPLIRKFWSKGLFEPLADRYLSLVDRSSDMGSTIAWETLDRAVACERANEIFSSMDNVGANAYFDKMTHFDMKTLLPALLQVEDRMSMAHGIESRVPFLDHHLVEATAIIPAIIKFEGGKMKNLLKQSFIDVLPPAILHRRDKMGFPVPLDHWLNGPLRDWMTDILCSSRSFSRNYINAKNLRGELESGAFSRKLWALLSLEIWQNTYHDKASEIRSRAIN